MTDPLDIKLDFRKKRSISIQLNEEIHRLFQEGILRPGSQLPTVRSLADQLHVNFNTVARVYRLLDQEGIISTQQGRGTYVIEDISSFSNMALSTREEQITRLINELFEKANRLQVSTKELQTAIVKRTKHEGGRRSANLRKKILGGAKKRSSGTSWLYQLRQIGSRTSSRTPNRKLKKKYS